jgi:sugar O-acyltransferase (sialic acid O-acetyltransferase NeuD family)
MIIIGARGHAKDILSVLSLNGKLENLYFFDNISADMPSDLYGTYPILRSDNEVLNIFDSDRSFALGIGGPTRRFNLCKMFLKLGGQLSSVVSNTAFIGLHDVELGAGVNIMTRAVLTNSIRIGEGALINAGAIIHHDVIIGKYTEISPGVIVAGGTSIGEFSSIGMGAKLLPQVKIGNNVTIGAGAVVTKNIEDNSLAIGVPAKIVKHIEPLKYCQ